MNILHSVKEAIFGPSEHEKEMKERQEARKMVRQMEEAERERRIAMREADKENAKNTLNKIKSAEIQEEKKKLILKTLEKEKRERDERRERIHRMEERERKARMFADRNIIINMKSAHVQSWKFTLDKLMYELKEEKIERTLNNMREEEKRKKKQREIIGKQEEQERKRRIMEDKKPEWKGFTPKQLVAQMKHKQVSLLAKKMEQERMERSRALKKLAEMEESERKRRLEEERMFSKDMREKDFAEWRKVLAKMMAEFSAVRQNMVGVDLGRMQRKHVTRKMEEQERKRRMDEEAMFSKEMREKDFAQWRKELAKLRSEFEAARQKIVMGGTGRSQRRQITRRMEEQERRRRLNQEAMFSKEMKDKDFAEWRKVLAKMMSEFEAARSKLKKAGTGQGQQRQAVRKMEEVERKRRMAGDIDAAKAKAATLARLVPQV